jgi:MoxR-like ATPase
MTASVKTGTLRTLGVIGWDHLEPVILAALATESPLLLVGPHGSAKTLVLTRLAEALGLEHRHYNASLLNFDDLIGFPVPDGGTLAYLQTPATIWHAESVFFDEVSRCRPDLQNKLFPIVHERRVQGVALDRLRYRWAAMNPPPRVDGENSDGFEYAGTEPLDVALADRFAFIVGVPDLKTLSRHDQATLLSADQLQPCAQAAGKGLVELLARIRSDLENTRKTLRTCVAEYVRLAAQKLADARHPISARRAVQLARNIEAVAAVLRTRGDDVAPEDAFYVALRHSLPDAAWGHPIDPANLLAIHRAAWQIARLEQGALKAVFQESDPVRRIALALTADSLPATERAQAISDSYASLDRMTRLATAAVLMPVLSRRQGLPAAAIETVAADYAMVAADSDVAVTVRRGGADWKRDILGKWLGALDLSSRRGKALANAAAVLMRDEHEFKSAALERAYDHAAVCFQGLTATPTGRVRRRAAS